MSRYLQLLQRLYLLKNRQRGKLHLENMLALCRAIDNPQNAFKSIHVAGTNGKGSVCSYIASGLKEPVGLYTSPHLSSFRERIQINRQYISESAVEKYLNYIFFKLDLEGLTASFFEITTAMAFLYFAENKLEYAVIETGLGGRYDATNVIAPLLTVITSISLEHTELLGNSLEEIAYEKGGIIKENVPVVIGPTVPYQIIFPIAKSKNAPLHIFRDDFSDFREENKAIAKLSLKTLGIEKTELHMIAPPCRFEIHKYFENLEIIFDVAHNPSGMAKLAHLLQAEYSPKQFICVIAISSNKDLKECLKPLLPFISIWFPVEASNGRSYPPEKLSEALKTVGGKSNYSV